MKDKDIKIVGSGLQVIGTEPKEGRDKTMDSMNKIKDLLMSAISEALGNIENQKLLNKLLPPGSRIDVDVTITKVDDN